jgi:hypothetical protein
VSDAHFTCPVCGFDQLEAEPYYDGRIASFSLCPACGTEFGFSDDPAACGVELAPDFAGPQLVNDPACRAAAHAGLRARWIAGGMKWWSARTAPPAGWDSAALLKRLTAQLG